MSDIEPTPVELDTIESEDQPKIQFSDQIYYFETGMVVVSRMITNMENSDGVLVLYKPAQIIHDEYGSTVLTHWMPEVVDDYIFIDPSRVMSMGTPNKAVLDAYRKIIGVTEHGYLPENTTLH